MDMRDRIRLGVKGLGVRLEFQAESAMGITTKVAGEERLSGLE